MQKLKLIIGREFFTRVKSKSFILITILVPVSIIAFIGITAFISTFKSDKQSEFVLIDQNNILDKDFKVKGIDLSYSDNNLKDELATNKMIYKQANQIIQEDQMFGKAGKSLISSGAPNNESGLISKIGLLISRARIDASKTKVQNGEIVDVLFNKYYSKLPANLQDYNFKVKKLALVQAAIGRIAPDFSWKENGKTKRLSTLKDGKKYLLVFWSTSCSHCVKEIPGLYTFMQTQKDTKVVAYALEREDFEWNEFTKQLYGWHHAIGLNPKDKWDNKLVTDTYQVHETPSYFILDANKKIISKPYDLKEIKKAFTQKK